VAGALAPRSRIKHHRRHAHIKRAAASIFRRRSALRSRRCAAARARAHL